MYVCMYVCMYVRIKLITRIESLDKRRAYARSCLMPVPFTLNYQEELAAMPIRIHYSHCPQHVPLAQQAGESCEQPSSLQLQVPVAGGLLHGAGDEIGATVGTVDMVEAILALSAKYAVMAGVGALSTHS